MAAAPDLPAALPPGDRPPPRVVVRVHAPLVDGGRHPVKRVVGEPVDVEAVAYTDGHDLLHVVAIAGGHRAAMTSAEAGFDRWRGRLAPLERGRHDLVVLGWVDHVASWFDGTRRKLEDGQAVTAELAEGAQLLRRAAADAPVGIGATHDDQGTGPDPAVTARLLEDAAAELGDGDTSLVASPTRSAAVVAAAQACLVVSDGAASDPVPLLVERERALVSAWYELFPRSLGAPGEHGTLGDVEALLPDIAAMGFDVVYLPPIHPIGTTHRKGPDNSPTAGAGDPGSPWAIGSPEGGHTAVHPELGTEDDVASLAAACHALGMDLALDVAFQCSPDHPWVDEHPDWFRRRPDGSIHYAENPPKKYQDIYPLNFESEDWRALWAACRDVFLFWADRGVRVFRVDNPHTKPFPFWAWCLEDVRRRHPDVVFLSEAFTRPAPMHGLAAMGFTQSYSYFPWRVGRAELTDYLTELASPPSVDELRPSLWPTTPDILPWHLQGASREQFALRVVLAAAMSPSYGVYGPAFELCENVPAGNGKEEFARSEKYELRDWDRNHPDSLQGLLTRINAIRRDQRALRTLRTARVHDASGDTLVVFSKTPHEGPSVDPTRPGDATVLVVVNLSDAEVAAGTLSLDLAALGVDPDRPYRAEDLLDGGDYSWEGANPYVELHPDRTPAHILRITQP